MSCLRWDLGSRCFAIQASLPRVSTTTLSASPECIGHLPPLLVAWKTSESSHNQQIDTNRLSWQIAFDITKRWIRASRGTNPTKSIEYNGTMHQSKPLAAQKCPKSPHARWRGTFAHSCSLAIYFLNLRTIHSGGKTLCRCYLCCQDVWFCFCFNQSKQRTISTLLAVTSHTSTRWSLSIQHVHVSAEVTAFFVLTARLVAYRPTHPIHHGPTESSVWSSDIS